MTWKPHATVAAVVEREGRFLMVRERDAGKVVYNQPAGHLESGESLLAAVVREVLEETARHFTAEALVGLYRWEHPSRGITFLRACFSGSVSAALPQALDPDIEAVEWLTREQLAARPQALRSPMVLACIDDYLRGQRFALDLLHEL